MVATITISASGKTEPGRAICSFSEYARGVPTKVVAEALFGNTVAKTQTTLTAAVTRQSKRAFYKIRPKTVLQ